MDFLAKGPRAGTAAVFAVLLLGAACGSTRAGRGEARIAVTAPASAGITRITVTVRQGDGSDFSPPIRQDLAGGGTQWSGVISAIPAGPDRQFEAIAYDVAGNALFEGSVLHVEIRAGENVTVIILLQRVRHDGSGNAFPVIEGLATPSPVPPGETVRISATAYDPDPADTIASLWLATCGAFDDPAALSPLWTAPPAEGTCVLSLTVIDNHGAAVTVAIAVAVRSGGTGSATVDVTVNEAPVVTLSGAITLGPTLTGTLLVSASDSDPLLPPTWSSDCPGIAFDPAPPHSAMEPGISMPGPSPSCMVSVVLTDARGGQGDASIVLPPNCVSCASDEVCQLSGQCVSSCTPACDGKVCGPDGCGGSCGPPCATGTCDANGQCVCTPACEGKVCGPDGCGGSCGPPCMTGTCDANGQCVVTGAVPLPDVAKQILAKQLNGIAMDLTASTYAAGAVGCTYDIGTASCLPVPFEGLSARPAGSNDAYVVKYAATNPYSAQWVSLFSGQGDASSASDQFATGTAVTANGTVVVSGTTNAGLVGGAINLPNNGQQTFLARVNGATGAGISAIQFDLGGGPLPGIAASKTSNLVAVCGSADKAATTLVPGAIFGGGTVKDVVIAVFDLGSATPLVPVWAKQLGGGADEQCDTVAIDDAGDVIVAGKYNWVTGQTLLDPGLGQLPDPNAGAGTPNSNRRHLWVAKYRGTDGLPLAQAAFGSGNGNHTAKSLAVDAAGNVVLGGAFTVSLPFGATTLTSAGSSDGFVAKLAVTGASFTPAWAVRIGAAGTAADLVNTVAVTSTGDVLAGGNFFGNTTGAASLTWSAGSDVFLLKVAGDVVAPATAPVTQFSAAYAAAGTQGLAAMACNRQGAGAALDAFAFGGSYDGQITISPLAPLPLSAGSSFLVFAPLVP